MSEYGAHWNFFFTLSTTALFSALFPLSGGQAALAASAIAAAYQTALSQTGLSAWLEQHERNMGDLIEANKEGIFSAAGYLALHAAGSAVGHICCAVSFKRLLQDIIHQRNASARQMNTRAGAVRRQAPISVTTGLVWLAAAPFAMATVFAVVTALDSNVQPTSRRLCNVAYIATVVALSCTMLWCSHLCDSLVLALFSKPPPQRTLFDGISKHQLPVFLAANVLTGAVNLSMDTLAASDGMALGVLVVYMALWCAVPAAVDCIAERWAPHRLRQSTK